MMFVFHSCHDNMFIVKLRKRMYIFVINIEQKKHKALKRKKVCIDIIRIRLKYYRDEII